MLHCGPKGGAWDLKAEQGRKAVSPGQGGQSETLTSASIRVTAALIPTAAPVRPPTLSPRLGIGLNWARKCVQAAQRQDKFQNPRLGLQRGRAGGRTSQGQRKCPAESCPLARGNPISVSSLPPPAVITRGADLEAPRKSLMVGGQGAGSLTDHVIVPAIPPLDGQTDNRGPGSSLSANPASLEGREGDRRRTKRKGRGGGEAGSGCPHGPAERPTPCSSVLLGEA